MSEIIKFTYEEIEDKCKKISEDISITNYQPDYILGISVGGIFPAIHFARLFNTKNLITVAVKSYDGMERKDIQVINLPTKDLLVGKSILLIDDISDSGSTLKFLVNLLKEEYKIKDIKTATLFVNEKNCQYYPDFYYEKVNKWIDFPWDRFEK
ncbi:MAG: phosphoribosyltransferase family protein [archaeon]|jgi:hypothetical protein